MPESIQELIATITNFDVYKELAQRTNSTYGADPRLQLLHSFMGVVGEQAEVLDHLNGFKKEHYLLGEEEPIEKLDSYSDAFDETSEKMLAEYGDLLWYCATLFDSLKAIKKHFELGDVKLPKVNLLFTQFTEFDVLCKNVVRIVEKREDTDTIRYGEDVVVSTLQSDALVLDDVKKVFVYKQKCKQEWFENLVHSLVDKIEVVVGYLHAYNDTYPINEDLTLLTLARSNIAKLASRFGEKFSVERSENRNYVQETKDSGIKTA